jgi:hypothetical protein
MDVRTVLEQDGFVVLPGVLSEAQCAFLAAKLAQEAAKGAGARNLLEAEWCAALAATLRDTLELGSALADCLAVQCTYFEKSAQVNWLVPLHQDLCIPVREKVEHPQLRGWARKEGALFVQPPAAVIERMVAVRVHIDDCNGDNGPLRVVPRSHRLGRLRVEDQRAQRDAVGEVACTTPRGGVVAMKPLLLHVSSKSTSSRPRRVLHYLYGPRELPFGLAWARAA